MLRTITRDDLKEVLQEAIAHGKVQIGVEPLQHIADHTKVIPDLVTASNKMAREVDVIHGWVNGKIIREQRWRARRHRAVDAFIEGASGTIGKVAATLLALALLGASALKIFGD